jgi:hypothetical protein
MCFPLEPKTGLRCHGKKQTQEYFPQELDNWENKNKEHKLQEHLETKKKYDSCCSLSFSTAVNPIEPQFEKLR